MLNERLWRGELSAAQLPETIDLGPIGMALDQMYEDSARDLRERVATLVLAAEGQLQLINQMVGVEDHAFPDVAVLPGHTFVGIVHTHPPMESKTGVAFSAADFAQMITDGNAISVLQTGRYQLALVRTEATPGFASQELLERQMAEAEREAKAEGHTTLQALVLANLKICVLYGLAFYHGYAPGPLQREERLEL